MAAIATGCSNPDMAASRTDREDKCRKVGRPRRQSRAVDPILMEQEILKKTGVAPAYVDEVLSAMTPSEISALALEYTASIELIRTKCDRLQGELSGELRK